MQGEIRGKKLGLVTFLTDFGWCGGYVAACEATITRISRDVRVLHVSHEVPVGDVATAALVLARVAPLYPEAVHLGVVDPGVGTSRRALALATARGDFLVGPDNGLLPDAGAALGGLVDGWALDIGEVRSRAGLPLDGVSATFHGRDLFAPASALLASGVDPACLGRPIELASLVRLRPTAGRLAGHSVSAPVIEIDRFGNVGLGVLFSELATPPDAQTRYLVEVGGGGTSEWAVRAVQTYRDLPSGELGLLRDSWGQASLALNGANAAEFLAIRLGAMVTLTPVGRLAQDTLRQRREERTR